MKKILFYLLLFPCLAFAQYAGFASSGYSAGAAEYLKRPMSAQTAALAGSVVAWRQGLAGTQFNPAIYDATPSGAIHANGTYTFMTLDRKLAGAEAAGTVGDFLACGLSFISYGVGNIEARDEYGNNQGAFSDLENAITASVAGRFLWNIAGGASVRYLYAGMHKDKNADPDLDLGEQANGVGVDLGATWEPLPQLCVGASVQNILSKLWWSTGTRDDVLATVRIGISGIFLKKSLCAELDFIKPLQQPEEISFGVQYMLLEMFSFRGGIASAVDLSEYHSKYPDYSLGLGFRYMFFGFDYALTIPESELGLSHKVSLDFTIMNIFK
jgi:hypothetical protein